MVEPIKELNRICQKPAYKQVGNWMVRHILRDAALPVTWLLLHTGVTANQVTSVSLLLGLAGICAIAFSSSLAFLVGTLLLQLWYYLDHVDGQIARYRKTASLSGRFFDFLVHHLIHAPIPFALGFYMFQNTEWAGWCIIGFIGSLATLAFNMINDIKAKTFFEHLCSKGKHFEIWANGKKKQTTNVKNGGEKPIARRLFALGHKLLEIHVLMNILTFCAAIEFFFGNELNFRFYLAIFYCALPFFLSLIKISHLIYNKNIDAEFRAVFNKRNTNLPSK